MNTEETLEQHFPTPALLRSHTGIDELINGLLRVMESASQIDAKRHVIAFDVRLNPQ